MSSFLKDYGITKEEGLFKVTFQIPDNSEYALSIEDDVHIIGVTLGPSAKEPSPVFVTYVEDFAPINETVIVDFELPDGGYSSGQDGDPVTKKPRLRIDDLKMS